jgi:hypothetical protein
MRHVANGFKWFLIEDTSVFQAGKYKDVRDPLYPNYRTNQLDGVDPPLRPGDVAHVARCQRDVELRRDRIYWVYRIHEDALVEMLFARAVVHQSRITFAMHGGTIVSPDDVVVAGILSRAISDVVSAQVMSGQDLSSPMARQSGEAPLVGAPWRSRIPRIW